MWGNGLKQFSVHRCSLWKCRELSCRILRNFDLYIWGSMLETCVTETPCLPKIISGTKILKQFLFYAMFMCNKHDLTTSTCKT